MSCKYEEYLFDKRANKYFVNVLKYGHELDRQLLKHIDIYRGEITAYLPKDNEKLNIYQFGGGGIAKRNSSIECIIGTIEKFLKGGGNNVCLFEDALSTPDDQFEKRNGVAILAFQDEVYFYIESVGVNKERIEYALTEAEQPNYFICALSSKPTEDFLNINNSSISIDKIEKFARRTEKIILGAYDGEGYLVWHKQRKVD